MRCFPWPPPADPGPEARPVSSKVLPQRVGDGRHEKRQKQRKPLAADDDFGHARASAAPGPCPSAIGTIAAISINVVIRIGRKRVLFASRIAALISMPRERSTFV